MSRLLPYLAGLLLLSMIGNAVMTKMYLGKRDEVSKQVELCNQQKLQSVAEAEAGAREVLQGSFDRRLKELEAIAMRESNGRRIAETARAVAEAEAGDAQAIIRQLTTEANDATDKTIEQICLVQPVPGPVLDGLRGQ